MDLTFPDTGEKKHSQFNWNAVSPDYFKAMSIPIHQGRSFSDVDAQGPDIVIVNRTFVERYLGDRRPIGTVFSWDKPKTIVGVVGNTKSMSIGEDDRAMVYQPFSQVKRNSLRVQFVARSIPPPATLLKPVQKAIRELEPEAGLTVATMYSSIGLAFLPSQIGAGLLGSIGLLGLLLAAIGLYGVMAYSVARRTREIGIRIAVGANRRDVSRMILADSVKLIFTGLGIGLAIAFFVTKPLSLFLVPGLRPSDPPTYVIVVLVLVAVGLMATWGPVRRALAVDPASSLRYE